MLSNSPGDGHPLKKLKQDTIIELTEDNKASGSIGPKRSLQAQESSEQSIQLKKRAVNIEGIEAQNSDESSMSHSSELPAHETKAINAFFKTSQSKLIKQIKKNEAEYKSLLYIMNTYNGLCDLLCNYVFMNDLLSRPIEEELWDDHLTKGLKLLEEQYASTHILESATYWQLFNCLLFNTIPYSLINNQQQAFFSNITTNINENFITRMLHHPFTEDRKDISLDVISRLEIGECLKVYLYKNQVRDIIKGRVGFGNVMSQLKAPISGHALLVRRNTEDSYSFYDPSREVRFNLQASDVLYYLRESYQSFNQAYGLNRIAFIDPNQHLPDISPQKEASKPVLFRNDKKVKAKHEEIDLDRVDSSVKKNRCCGLFLFPK